MKKYFCIFCLLFIGLLGIAQQDPQLNQYMFNPLYINPAYAGSREAVSAVLLNRIQWIGFDDAPNTQVLSIHAPLKSKQIGLGFNVVNDQLGPSHSISFLADYAYRIRVGNGKLSFGLRGGVYNYRFDWNKIEYYDPSDVYANMDVTNVWLPSFDFGVRYHTGTLHSGISIAHFNQPDFKYEIHKDSSIARGQLYSHITVNAGKIYEINNKVAIRPSLLFKTTFVSFGVIDINCSVLLDKRIWLGISGRSNKGLVLITEYNITSRFRMGYSYDLSTNRLKTAQSGSHELFIGFDFDLPHAKYILPRYF